MPGFVFEGRLSMKYIETFREGMHVSDVYLCKSRQIALTKNGKEYGSVVLQDKTGTIDGKIWDLRASVISMPWIIFISMQM